MENILFGVENEVTGWSKFTITYAFCSKIYYILKFWVGDGLRKLILLSSNQLRQLK